MTNPLTPGQRVERVTPTRHVRGTYWPIPGTIQCVMVIDEIVKGSFMHIENPDNLHPVDEHAEMLARADSGRPQVDVRQFVAVLSNDDVAIKAANDAYDAACLKGYSPMRAAIAAYNCVQFGGESPIKEKLVYIPAPSSKIIAGIIDDKNARIDAQATRIAELEAALKPFAEAGQYYLGSAATRVVTPAFLIGNFRRARAAFAKEK